MTQVRKQRFGQLDVVVTGGTDGLGGGQGPLCVLLHGFGAPGTDLVPLGQLLEQALARTAGGVSGLRFAFPAAPLSLTMDGMEGGLADLLGMGDSRAWWLIDMERLQRMMMTGRMAEMMSDEPEGLSAAREQLTETLDELQKALTVPQGQLVLGGFSQGSMLSLDLALRSRLPLRGLILWSSTIIAQEQWQKNLSSRPGLRVFQSHGRQDALLPFAVAKALRDKLSAGGFVVDWHEFAGGHEIPPPVLQGTLAFLRTTLLP